MFSKGLWWLVSVFFLSASAASAQGLDQTIDNGLKPIAKWFDSVIFTSVPLFGQQVPIVLLLLAGTAIFLTCFFGFINLRGLGLAVRTVKGKYSKDGDPGQITHFQALSTAVSATVGLGNIAGVAIAISLGGPGAVFWMVFMGFMGMTSKFTECTLGVKYRIIDKAGKAHGGGMYYLRDGLAEKGLGGLGKVLAVIFAIACIGGAVGAGNMFQVNQAHAQVSETFGLFENQGWLFGLIVAVLTAAVILGGIVSIARVTSLLVPFMCVTYLIACLVVLTMHFGAIPAALGTIVTEAFNGEAVAGGVIICLIQGVKRGVFSNEAGVGSAAMAHAAVKTDKPASEGVVALLEPFIDTVVVCTMTALVIIVTGMWQVNSDVNVEQVEVVSAPGVAGSVATYSEGDRLQVESQWQELTGEEGGGWIAAGADLEKEVDVYVSPTADEPMATRTVDADNVSEQVWAQVSDPNAEALSGFVPMAQLNDRSDFAGGIWRTSEAFETVISWFPYVLAVAVFLFAFSTLISWSYYGEQAVGYLFGGSEKAVFIYKIVFCLFAIVGSSAALDSVLLLSDAMFFAMVVPNIIGLYLLLPVVKRELKKYREHVDAVDRAAQ